MSKIPETTAAKVCLSGESLRNIVGALGRALKPQVNFHPDHQSPD